MLLFDRSKNISGRKNISPRLARDRVGTPFWHFWSKNQVNHTVFIILGLRWAPFWGARNVVKPQFFLIVVILGCHFGSPFWWGPLFAMPLWLQNVVSHVFNSFRRDFWVPLAERPRPARRKVNQPPFLANVFVWPVKKNTSGQKKHLAPAGPRPARRKINQPPYFG